MRVDVECDVRASDARSARVNEPSGPEASSAGTDIGVAADSLRATRRSGTGTIRARCINGTDTGVAADSLGATHRSGTSTIEARGINGTDIGVAADSLRATRHSGTGTIGGQ